MLDAELGWIHLAEQTAVPGAAPPTEGKAPAPSPAAAQREPDHVVTVYEWWNAPLFHGNASPADWCQSADPDILRRPHELPRIPPPVPGPQLRLFDMDDSDGG